MKNPYGLMYIYYMDGCVKQLPKLDESFIGNWEEDGFSFLFFKQKARDTLQKILEKNPGLTLLDSYEMSYDEWQGEELKPFLIGKFLIRQPWNRPDFLLSSIRDTIPITLDPGVVFGAGNHPTTSVCLELIAEIFEKEAPETVLDFGTGTGLLALACGKLGSQKILALDFNYLAAKTAHTNILHNSLEKRIISIQGLAQDYMNLPSDLFIANIHYDIMKKIILSPDFLTKKRFILSGLLKSQAEKVDKILSDLPVQVNNKKTTDGIWYTYMGEITPL